MSRCRLYMGACKSSTGPTPCVADMGAAAVGGAMLELKGHMKIRDVLKNRRVRCNGNTAATVDRNTVPCLV